MARKFLYIIAFLIVVVLAVMIVLRFWAKDLSEMAFVPGVEFASLSPVEAEAYSRPAMWISRPGMGESDPARFLPAGAQAPDTSLGAAVFFVHPTSFFESTAWNGALDHEDSRKQAAKFVRDMASPFNISADLWVPRYRQATFGAFLTDASAADKAIDAAYGDILAAFDHFVATVNENRPIVLAGHSQGAFHLRRLIAERVKGAPLQDRIAIAYLVGWPVSIARDLPELGMPACTGPDQTGCVASWQSFAEPAEHDDVLEGQGLRQWLDGTRQDGRPYLCSNPLAGMTNDARPASANKGSLVREEGKARLEAGLIPARCDDEGFLLIGPPPELGNWVLPGNNYHVYDIPMFWADVRADASRRVEAWQATR